MRISISSAFSGRADAVVRFVKSGRRVFFSDPTLEGAYAAMFPGDELILEHKQLAFLRLKLEGGYSDVIFAGFDSECGTPYSDFRSMLLSVGEKLRSMKAASAVIDRLDELSFADEAALVCQLGSVLPLCEYKYDKYLSEKEDEPETSVTLIASEQCAPALAEGMTLEGAVCHARDLINEMADVLTPSELAARTRRLGAEYGFDVEVYDKSECERLGMGLFLAVSSASRLEPKLIVMRYNGGDAAQPPIALVGKGITYDSGGLSLKSGSMESMRFDMNGAAAVIGTMCAAAGQHLEKNIVAVVAACENAIGSGSYRNGDVVRSMSGKTVFVRNTDAEGRLTMADAMTYAVRRFAPSELIEVAGLTGSVCNFFGDVCAAVLATDEKLFEHLAGQSELSGEKFAAMPYYPEYRKKLKSPYADLDNAPAGGCGGILAGFFLEAFREDVPFIHIDFGAMPFTSKKSPGQPEGGTGFGVRSLYYYIKNR